MTAHKFGNRYTEADFLAAMPENTFITSTGIKNRVGCSLPTLQEYLKRLEEQNKISRIEIIDGRDAVWVKNVRAVYITDEK